MKLSLGQASINTSPQKAGYSFKPSDKLGYNVNPTGIKPIYQIPYGKRCKEEARLDTQFVVVWTRGNTSRYKYEQALQMLGKRELKPSVWSTILTYTIGLLLLTFIKSMDYSKYRMESFFQPPLSQKTKVDDIIYAVTMVQSRYNRESLSCWNHQQFSSAPQTDSSLQAM